MPETEPHASEREFDALAVLTSLRKIISSGEVSLEGTRSHLVQEVALRDIVKFRNLYMPENPEDKLAEDIFIRFTKNWEIAVAATQRAHALYSDIPPDLPDLTSKSVSWEQREQLMAQFLADSCQIIAELTEEARSVGKEHIPYRLLDLKIALYHSPDEVRQIKSGYARVPEYKLVEGFRLNAKNPLEPLDEYLESRALEEEPAPFENAQRYMQDIRRFCMRHGGATVSNRAESKVHAAAALEKAGEYLERQSDLTGEAAQGFRRYARILGVVSYKVHMDFPAYSGFNDLPPANQEAVLEKLHSDYVAICSLLTNTKGEIRRESYEANPVLYRSPGEVAKLMREHSDLQRSHLLRVIFDHMADAEEFITEAKRVTAGYHRAHPEVSWDQLFWRVISHPKNQEAAITEYLWKQSAHAEKAAEKAINSPETYLTKARELLRTTPFDDLGLRPDQRRAIQTLGEEAVQWLRYNLYHVSSRPLGEHQREKVMYEFRQIAALVHAATMAKSVRLAPLDRLPLETQTAVWGTILKQAITVNNLAREHLGHQGFHVHRFCAFYSPTKLWKLIERHGEHLDTSTIIATALRNPRQPDEAMRKLIEGQGIVANDDALN